MTQTIHRLYASHDTAVAAADALRASRTDTFDDIHVFAGGRSADELVDAMTRAFVLRAHARTLANEVQRGATLVTVHAPFGSAIAAIHTLERFRPIGAGVPEFTDPADGWDEAAPLSSALRLPVLSRSKGPYHGFGGLPLLTAGQGTTSEALGLPPLSRSRGPYTGLAGLPLLSDRATPLSSMLGLPVLTRPQTRSRR
jgi:hypothetical protein